MSLGALWGAFLLKSWALGSSGGRLGVPWAPWGLRGVTLGPPCDTLGGPKGGNVNIYIGKQWILEVLGFSVLSPCDTLGAPNCENINIYIGKQWILEVLGVSLGAPWDDLGRPKGQTINIYIGKQWILEVQKGSKGIRWSPVLTGPGPRTHSLAMIYSVYKCLDVWAFHLNASEPGGPADSV